MNSEGLKLKEWVQKLADMLGVNPSNENLQKRQRDGKKVPVEVVHESKYPFY